MGWLPSRVVPMDCQQAGGGAEQHRGCASYRCRDAPIQASASTQQVRAHPVVAAAAAGSAVAGPAARSRSPRRQAAVPSAYSEYA